MLTKRVRRAFGALALAPLLITACDSNPFDPFDEALGTYQLSVFAGSSVPRTFNCAPNECGGIPNGGTVRVNGGTLTLHGDGTYSEQNQFTFTPTVGGSFDDEFESIGTFTLNGESLSLSDPVSDRFIDGSLQVIGNDVRINYNEDGQAYEYRKGR